MGQNKRYYIEKKEKTEKTVNLNEKEKENFLEDFQEVPSYIKELLTKYREVMEALK